MQVLARIIAAVWTATALGAAAAQVSYHWTDITPPGGQVFSVGTHPLDGRIIVMGQWSVQGKVVSVMYSSDHGATWKAPDTPPPESATSMFVHVGLPGVVYMEDAGSSYPASQAHGGHLYRSADFGRTWSLFQTSAIGDWIHLFASDPLDAHGMFGFERRDGPSFVPGGRNANELGIGQTHDDGANWSAPQAPPFPPGYTNGFQYVAGPTPADPMRIFLRTPDLRLWESRDRGATWSPFPSSLPPGVDDVVPDPLRANVLYRLQYYFDATYGNHYVTQRSDDGGASWRDIRRSPFSSGAAPVVDPAHGQTVWLGPEADTGTSFVFPRTDDGGETWQAVPYPGGPYTIPGLFNYQGLFPSPAEPGTVYVLQGFRLFRGVRSAPPDPVVVEFQYEGDRYWSTSLDGEALSQSYRSEPGHVSRTGLKWGAWNAADAPAGALGSCRFWSKPETGLRTRVLVLQGFECDILKRMSGWILEAENEFFAVPPGGGGCASGLVPVRRFNNLKADLNHRWVADSGAAADMRARGWYDEGVRFCARPLGSNE